MEPCDGGWWLVQTGWSGKAGERTFTLIPEWPATQRSDARGSGKEQLVKGPFRQEHLGMFED